MVVSEYGLPRPRRRPMRPRSTPSSHSSPASRRSGLARRARPGGRRPWTPSPARRAPRRGPSSSCSRPACPRQDRVAGLATTACSDTARRRPHGLGTTSSARRRRWASGCSASSPSTPLADIAENWPPGGHRGTQMSETEGFAGVRGGRRPDNDSARKACKTAENGQQQRCRRRDSNPRHADYDSAALTD